AMRLNPLVLLATAAAITPAAGGPLAYAACQTGTFQAPKSYSSPPGSADCIFRLILSSPFFLFYNPCPYRSRKGCNGLAVACYAAAGFTFGVTIVGAPPAILACNVGLGTCMATCATVGLFAPPP